MPEEVWPDAEPFSFEGGKTGVLVVHGFTGCTQSMLPLGEGLAAAGCTVIGPRLPGHGTTVQDMGTRKWDEWTSAAEKGLMDLLDRCDKVFITGLSMGGTITCYLGERYADKLAGIMPINAAVAKLNPLMPLTPVAKYVLKTIPGVGSDIKDPDIKESCYDKVAVPAAAELHALMKLTKRDLAKITEPILVFTSREDHVVPPANGAFIMKHVSSTDKEQVWLENSYHVATLDFDKDEIIKHCVEFIQRLA
jgi:carboxylesterase